MSHREGEGLAARGGARVQHAAAQAPGAATSDGQPRRRVLHHEASLAEGGHALRRSPVPVTSKQPGKPRVRLHRSAPRPAAHAQDAAASVFREFVWMHVGTGVVVQPQVLPRPPPAPAAPEAAARASAGGCSARRGIPPCDSCGSSGMCSRFAPTRRRRTAFTMPAAFGPSRAAGSSRRPR